MEAFGTPLTPAKPRDEVKSASEAEEEEEAAPEYASKRSEAEEASAEASEGEKSPKKERLKKHQLQEAGSKVAQKMTKEIDFYKWRGRNGGTVHLLSELTCLLDRYV